MLLKANITRSRGTLSEVNKKQEKEKILAA